MYPRTNMSRVEIERIILICGRVLLAIDECDADTPPPLRNVNKIVFDITLSLLIVIDCEFVFRF